MAVSLKLNLRYFLKGFSVIINLNNHICSIQSFQSMGSKSFNESLQVIEKSKSIVYIGAKSGNIFKVKSDVS